MNKNALYLKSYVLLDTHEVMIKMAKRFWWKKRMWIYHIISKNIWKSISMRILWKNTHILFS